MTVELARPAFHKPCVHAAVVRRLGHSILSGDLKPGEALPNEARPCADLSISRTALREAIRVLVAKGLIETKPRTGTRVRPHASPTAREKKGELDILAIAADDLVPAMQHAPRTARDRAEQGEAG